MGLVKNLQVAFYLNSQSESQLAGDSSFASINTDHEFSFSNEWKYKLSDASGNKLGSALYLELGVATNETELEGKIILDKQIGNSVHALNIVGETEWEKEAELEDGEAETETEMELNVEFNYGFSYRLSNHFRAGFEVRNHNEYVPKPSTLVGGETQAGSGMEWEHSALFAGPVISWATENAWINLTVLPQVAGLHHAENNFTDGLVLDEHERMEVRLLFSFAF